MGNVCDALTSRLSTAEERISQSEHMSRETSKPDSKQKTD